MTLGWERFGGSGLLLIALGYGMLGLTLAARFERQELAWLGILWQRHEEELTERLLLSLGFEERTRGSHHMFSRSDIPELINLQGEGGDAKPYQVRQIRRIILRYGLHEAADE